MQWQQQGRGGRGRIWNGESRRHVVGWGAATGAAREAVGRREGGGPQRKDLEVGSVGKGSGRGRKSWKRRGGLF